MAGVCVFTSGYWTCHDHYQPGKLQPHKWTDLMTMGRSWGFDRLETVDVYKTPEQLVEILVNNVAYGGESCRLKSTLCFAVSGIKRGEGLCWLEISLEVHAINFVTSLHQWVVYCVSTFTCTLQNDSNVCSAVYTMTSSLFEIITNCDMCTTHIACMHGA